MITIKTIPLTTARVVDSPTAVAPVPVCRPRRQPMAGDENAEDERLDQSAEKSIHSSRRTGPDENR